MLYFSVRKNNDVEIRKRQRFNCSENVKLKALHSFFLSIFSYFSNFTILLARVTNLYVLRRISIKKAFGIFVLASACVSTYAQDIHFTQFYASPLTLNPANTGHYRGDLRAVFNYRNQWKAIDNKAYSTVALGVENQFPFYSDMISAGITFVNDNSGYGDLTVNKLLLSGSYSKEINGHKLRGGVQLGGVLKSNNFDKYTFDNQFVIGHPDVFNTDLPSGETNYNESIAYLDVNIGVGWSKRLSKAFEPEAGFSIFHVNYPKETFFDIANYTNHLPLRNVFHGGGYIYLGESGKMHLNPNFLYMYHKRATDLLIGTNLERRMENPTIKAIFAGTLFRYGWGKNYDASSWIVGAQIKNYRAAISYDVNISSLSEATNYRGAFELSIIYITESTKPTKIKIPCDRL